LNFSTLLAPAQASHYSIPYSTECLM